ncbi:MAG: beta-ketoacyl-ACP synthase II [Lentisphaeria bacterium]|nr:beta-ketoacyl-ACP synthase II [Lentisphaeria bacterium]
MFGARRVVVTGIGAISCVGNDVASSWRNLLAGRSGIGPITRFDASSFRCQIGGEVRDFDIEQYVTPKEARRMDPFCHLAIGAAEEAVVQSGLKEAPIRPERVGVVVSSGIGGLDTTVEQVGILHARGPGRVSPLTIPMLISDIASGLLSIRFGFSGPNLCIVTACASGAHSIGEAAWMIARGDADVMLAGGAERGVNPLGVSAFGSMRALSNRNDDPQAASRPFERDRDGFVPAEGAGVLVLEDYEHAVARGAEILAELAGYGLSGDAYHITAPDPSGSGAIRAISRALELGQINRNEVGYVNAHGTSTSLNDSTETAALKQVFGEGAYALPVSSTKSMMGHTLGAAGALEAVVCVQALRTGSVPPTINYETPDPDCDLDYVPNEARDVNAEYALSLNLGFGGHNAALLFKKSI